MLRLITVALLLITLIPDADSAKLMKIHWLSNGGKIISYFDDWIIIEILSLKLPGTITCPRPSCFYLYKPGKSKRFINLSFPVKDRFSIGITQKGVWFDDGANIQGVVN